MLWPTSCLLLQYWFDNGTIRLILISCKFFYICISSLHLQIIAVNQMTMIYDPIPFVKLVRKILVGNYEPIMRICGKIFTINWHNLQMLLLNKNKFSECQPSAQTWRSPMEDFLATVLPRPTDKGAFGGIYPQIFFVPPKFYCTQKNCFKHMIKIKILPP